MHESETANPYQAPKESEASSPIEPPSPKHYLAWSLLFAANLFIPGFAATVVVGGKGWVGVAFALVGLLVLIWTLHAFVPRITEPMWSGAICTAVLQVLPVLQMVAGAVALHVIHILRLTETATIGFKPIITQVAPGYVATFSTGMMLAAAYVVGLLIQLRQSRIARKPATDS